MKHLADHDPLTGLSEPPRGSPRPCRARSRTSAATASAGALLILDLDGFKAVNDAHGHEAGDRLLVDVSRRAALPACARPTSSPVWAGTSSRSSSRACALQEATVVADKVTAHIRERRLGGPHHPVTASVGVAPFGANHESGEEVMRDADLAMYSAKGAGRDRWAVHGRHQEALQG